MNLDRTPALVHPGLQNLPYRKEFSWNRAKIAKDRGIRYGGEEFTAREFFTKGTYSSWGLNKDRVFSAPDGQKYRWILGARVPSLFREDGSDTAIAIYHRPTLFGQYKSEKVRLEIFPEGQNMLRGHSTDLRQAKSSEAFKVQGDT